MSQATMKQDLDFKQDKNSRSKNYCELVSPYNTSALEADNVVKVRPMVSQGLLKYNRT